MIIYKDAVTSDELLTDAKKLTVIEDFFFEVDGKNIQVSNQIDEALIGGNASAEDAPESTNDGVETKIDVIESARLVSVPYDKKSYQKHIKDYIAAILKKKESESEDEAATFKKRAGAAVKKVLENFKNWEFYTGESMNPDGMVILMDYREDGITPYFWFIKDGLIAEKV